MLLNCLPFIARGAACFACMTSFNPHHNVLNEVGIILTVLQPRKLGGSVGSKSLCNLPKVPEPEQEREECQCTHS